MIKHCIYANSFKKIMTRIIESVVLVFCLAELKDSGASSESRLKKQNLQLKEENNFLKYKVEVLLDMVGCQLAVPYLLATALSVELGWI